jgi:hypothetical protein
VFTIEPLLSKNTHLENFLFDELVSNKGCPQVLKEDILHTICTEPERFFSRTIMHLLNHMVYFQHSSTDGKPVYFRDYCYYAYCLLDPKAWFASKKALTIQAKHDPTLPEQRTKLNLHDYVAACEAYYEAKPDFGDLDTSLRKEKDDSLNKFYDLIYPELANIPVMYFPLNISLHSGSCESLMLISKNLCYAVMLHDDQNKSLSVNRLSFPDDVKRGGSRGASTEPGYKALISKYLTHKSHLCLDFRDKGFQKFTGPKKVERACQFLRRIMLLDQL